MLDKLNIKKAYVKIGYLNFILSIIYLIVPNIIDFSDLLLSCLFINGIYHFFYFFFINILENKLLTSNSFNKIFGVALIKFIATLGIVASVFMLYTLLSQAIVLGEYQAIFFICMPFGIFLGAYSVHKRSK